MPSFDPLELNFTKVKAWLDCPFLYRFLYVEKRFAPPSPHGSLGVSVHRALDRYHREGGDLEDLFRYYDAAWGPQGFATPQQSMEFYGMGRQVLENYWLAWQDDTRKVLFTEKDFAFGFEKWTIKGSVDRIDRLPGGACEVVDYKMGFDGKAPDPAGSLQLAVYALGAERGLGLKPAKITFVFLMKGERVSADWDPAFGEKALEKFREAGEGIASGSYGRRGNCASCPVRKLCRESQAPD